MANVQVVDGPLIIAPSDKRLVLALEDGGIDILHRCGGHAECTTCRVKFTDGEPDTFTEAEAARLQHNNLLGKVRLSCQILCDHDMTVEPVYRLHEMDNMDDAGPRPEDEITPEVTRRLPRSEVLEPAS